MEKRIRIIDIKACSCIKNLDSSSDSLFDVQNDFTKELINKIEYCLNIRDLAQIFLNILLSPNCHYYFYSVNFQFICAVPTYRHSILTVHSLGHYEITHCHRLPCEPHVVNPFN